MNKQLIAIVAIGAVAYAATLLSPLATVSLAVQPELRLDAAVAAQSPPLEAQATTDMENGELPTDELKGHLRFYKSPGLTGRELGSAGIYPKAGSNEEFEYFHRPTWARHSVSRLASEKSGTAILLLRYSLSHPDIRDAASRELQESWGVPARVWPWPVTGVLIHELKTRTNRSLGKTTQVVHSREQVEFVVEVSDEVADLIEQRPELFVADIYYATRTHSYAKGTLSISGKKEIQACVRDVISQRDPSLENADLAGHLVIGNEIAEVKRRVKAMLQRNFEITHPDALPYLDKQPTMLVDQLIATMGIDELNFHTLLNDLDRNEVAAAVAQYLLPRIRDLNRNRVGSEHELTITEGSKTTTSGDGGSLITPIVGFSGRF